MEDINQAFGGNAPQSNLEEKWHQAQKRKQYNIVRVKNISKFICKGTEYIFLPKDFYVEYDVNQHQRIAADTTIDIPFYIAIRYLEHKKDEMVNQVNQKLHDDYLAERDRKGLPRYVDKATENKDTYETDPYPKSNDPKVIEELFGQLYVGLVHAFGLDTPPANDNSRTGEVDLTPISQKVFEGLSNRRVDPADSPAAQFQSTPIPTMTPPPPVGYTAPSGFSAMNEKLSAEEITNE